MERKLAHIELISEIKEIPNTQNIEVAEVLGWQCVVKKGEFKVGDVVIYVEVDSVMPQTPEFEFLRERKFRVKTIKLRGQVSQGLVLPIDAVSEQYNKGKLSIGDDVSAIIGITKYLAPSERDEMRQEVTERGKIARYMRRYSFFRKLFLKNKDKRLPYWVSKTDEERIQNIGYVLSNYPDSWVYVTEKVDYQSATFTGKFLPRYSGILGRLLPKAYRFIVCSRNFQVFDKNSLYWRVAQKYNLDAILRANPTLTIQGEQGDTNVQGNKYGIKEPMLWVFNIIDHEKRYQYDYGEMEQFCKKYGLTTVPLITMCKLSDIGTSVKEVIEYSKGKSCIADIEREGIVVRCVEYGKKKLSFKAINPNFLLKYDSE